MKALSIRQPWAWLIVNGHKDIENRTLRSWHRGPLLIHASQTMKKEDYALARQFAAARGVTIPAAGELPRGGIVGRHRGAASWGGIVGRVEMTDCVNRHTSPWFEGSIGYVMENPETLPFQACLGQLGIFNATHPAVDEKAA
jgi:hypothetical protein